MAGKCDTKEQAIKKAIERGAGYREGVRGRKKKKKPRWEREIAFSRWIMFRPRERKLMIKIFTLSLDYHIKKAKKSHWIKLECRWKNMGCKPGRENEEGIPTSVRAVKKRG